MVFPAYDVEVEGDAEGMSWACNWDLRGGKREMDRWIKEVICMYRTGIVTIRRREEMGGAV